MYFFYIHVHTLRNKQKPQAWPRYINHFASMFVRIHGYLIPSQGCWCTHLMATLPLKGSGSAGGHVLDPWPCGALIGRPPATLLPPTIITDLSSFIFSLLSLSLFFASIDLLSLHIFFPRYLCCYTFFVVTVTTIHLFRIPLPLQFPSKLVVSFFLSCPVFLRSILSIVLCNVWI